MNIAIFSDAFPPQINGVVSHVIDISTELSRLGHDVTIFAPKPRRGVKLDLDKFHFRTVLIPSIPTFLYPDLRITIPYLPRLFRLFKKHRIDIIHIHDPFTIGTEGLIAGRIFKIPTVITFHTFFLDEEFVKTIRMQKVVSLLKNHLWRLTSTYHNQANMVICPSIVSQKELIKYGLKVPSIVINNGFDLKRVRKIENTEKNNLRLSLGLRVEDSIGLFLGRLAVDKSIHILIESWQKVCNFIPQAKLLIIGSGPYGDYLKQLVSKLNLEKNVIFTGEIPREEMLKKGLINIADFFITASKIENQSLAIIEAMAHGLPIIGVNMRGIPELIDETTGMIVTPDNPQKLAEAVIYLIKNKNKLKNLGYGSSKKVNKFNLPKTVKQLEDVYKKLVNKSL